MSKTLVICEINENYLKNVKKQMTEQKLPMPKDDVNITIAHKPLTKIEVEKVNCNCKVCNKILSLR